MKLPTKVHETKKNRRSLAVAWSSAPCRTLIVHAHILEVCRSVEGAMIINDTSKNLAFLGISMLCSRRIEKSNLLHGLDKFVWRGESMIMSSKYTISVCHLSLISEKSIAQ